MYKKYTTNYKGYISVLRILQIYLKDQTITLTEFAAYLILIMNADFDTRHESYGQIMRSDSEIAEGVGSDQSTIYRHRTSLIRKGLLLQEDRYTYVKLLDLYTSTNIGKIAKMEPSRAQHYLAILKRNNALSYDDLLKHNAETVPPGSKSNNSSNENSIVSDIDNSSNNYKEDIDF